MKKFVPLAVVAVFATLPVSGAWAVDIINEDSNGFTLLVKSGDDAQDVEIGGNQTLQGVCDACEVMLDDGEPVKASGDQIVVIKGGKATIRG